VLRGAACFVCCVGLPAWRTADYCVAAASRERLALVCRAWQRESSSSHGAAERQRELPLDFWLQEVFACLGEAGRSVSRFLRGAPGGTSVSTTLENCRRGAGQRATQNRPRGLPDSQQ